MSEGVFGLRRRHGEADSTSMLALLQRGLDGSLLYFPFSGFGRRSATIASAVSQAFASVQIECRRFFDDGLG